MCAPKTKVIYLWKPASLSIFFSSHPNWCSAHILYFIFLFHVIQQLLHLTPLLMSLHLHFISFLQWPFSISTSWQSFHGGEVITNPKHKPGKTFFLIQKFMMNIENLHISYMLFKNMKSLAWIYINFGSVINFFYQKGQESVIWACGLRILGKFM